jgi:hypothetical protein
VTLAIDDRVEIEELIYGYARACDFDGTAEVFMTEFFTEDIVLDGSIMGVYDGPDGVARWAAELAQQRRGLTLRHVISNLVIRESSEGAVARSYLTELMIFPTSVIGRSDQVHELAFAGEYTFELRKLNGAWRIARRTVVVTRHQASPER